MDGFRLQFLNTSGAKFTADFILTNGHSNFLDIGLKGSGGSVLGMRPVSPDSGTFPT